MNLAASEGLGADNMTCIVVEFVKPAEKTEWVTNTDEWNAKAVDLLQHYRKLLIY